MLHGPVVCSRTDGKLIELATNQLFMPCAVNDAEGREPVHAGETAIVQHTALESETIMLAIFGNQRDACLDGIPGSGESNLLSMHENPPGLSRLRAGNGTRDIASAAADQSKHPQNFS